MGQSGFRHIKKRNNIGLECIHQLFFSQIFKLWMPILMLRRKDDRDVGALLLPTDIRIYEISHLTQVSEFAGQDQKERRSIGCITQKGSDPFR
jgi:hypothetical protein